MMMRRNKEIILTSALIFGPLLVLGGFFLWANISVGDVKVSKEVEAEKPLLNPFETVSLDAEAAYVKNTQTGEVYFSKNENKSLALASLTKVMTVLVANKLLENKSVWLRPDDLNTEGESGFFTYESFNTKDLIDFTLVGSSNDGAAALAFSAGSILKRDDSANFSSDDLFVLEMNKLASKIGMDNTKFENATGLDENIFNASAFGSAKDVTVLFEYVLKNEPRILEATKHNKVNIYSEQGLPHTIENTNEIVDSLPNILGSKTGYTDIAGGNLAVVIDPGLNTPIIITVLNSTKEGRFKDVKALTEATLGYLQIQDKK